MEVIVDGEDYEILRWQAPDVVSLGEMRDQESPTPL